MIAARLARKTGSSDSTPDYLEKLQKLLVKIYDFENTCVIETANLPLSEVVKKVAKVIFKEKYKVVVFDPSKLKEEWS